MTDKGYTIQVAKPHGMCGGVRRALALVEEALRGAEKIYVLHEIVHNNYIVHQLTKRGVVFVQELSEVPEGETVLFSAHGVSQAVEAEAARRHLHIVDATCPLVKKLHREVRESVERGEGVVLLGHAGHPEVEGTLGQVPKAAIILLEGKTGIRELPEYEGREVRLLTQTTLEMSFVEEVAQGMLERYGKRLKRGDGVCYATRDRQRAVQALATEVELIIVIGSPRSSNSNRLREVAEKAGVRAELIDDPEEIRGLDFGGIRRIGVTAGASAPDELLEMALSILEQRLEERKGCSKACRR